jgi:hypothetical protein
MPSLLTESIELTSVMIIVVKKNLGVYVTIMPVTVVVLMDHIIPVTVVVLMGATADIVHISRENSLYTTLN